MNPSVKLLLPDVITALPIGILVLDGEGNCHYANPMFQQMAELEGEQTLGKVGCIS